MNEEVRLKKLGLRDLLHLEHYSVALSQLHALHPYIQILHMLLNVGLREMNAACQVCASGCNFYGQIACVSVSAVLRTV